MLCRYRLFTPSKARGRGGPPPQPRRNSSYDFPGCPTLSVFAKGGVHSYLSVLHPLIRGKFHFNHKLTNRSTKQTAPTNTAAHRAESPNLPPAPINADPIIAAVAYTSARNTCGTWARNISRITPPPTAVIVPSRTATNAGNLYSIAFSVPAIANSASPAASTTSINGAGIPFTYRCKKKTTSPPPNASAA
jgi:hypothetical protein